MKIHRWLNLGSRAVFALLWLTVSSACVYKLDIQQGNVVERDKVAQLKTGMTKRQVRYLLGTPLIIDTFNQDRWDYFFSIKYYTPDHRDKGIYRQERLTIFFENGQLSRMDNHLIGEKPTLPVQLDTVKSTSVGPGPTGENQPEQPPVQ